ncbi:MAG: ZinT/AdcA family metal-binding protein [Peptostreptococcaceae bacterium]|nr:ZinT/AdcA family metal-binding protein [Peptostreptococcaceae bacterium]
MKRLVALASALLLSVALTACNKPAEKSAEQPAPATEQTQEQPAAESEEPAPAEEAVSLADWEGTWDDMSLWLDLPEVEEGYKLAAEKDGVTPEEVKEALKKRRRSDFHGMIVEGNKLTLLDNWAAKGGKEIGSAEYEFVQSHAMEESGHSLEWDEFKATSADAKYPVLLMMPVHGEEALTHFHMRYGDNAETLLKMEEKWYPTFVKPSTTAQQMIEEIAE